jgi:hypothetical protein
LKPGFAPGFFFAPSKSQISGIWARKKTRTPSRRRVFDAIRVTRFASLYSFVLHILDQHLSEA